MGEIVRFDSPYWKGFYLPDGKQRWFYTDERLAIRLKDKERIPLKLSSIEAMRQKKIRLNQYLI